MNPDDFKVTGGLSTEDFYRLKPEWSNILSTATVQQAEQSYLNHIARQRHELEREQLRGKLKAFRESYIKIRTNNVVLDHQSAIELTKLIYAEADTLTYEDMS